MQPKTMKILVVATVAFVVLAVLFQQLGGPGGGGSKLPERIAPGLADRLNDVAEIEITGPDGSLDLTKAGEGWAVASKDGYPAEFETVKQLLVGLAELAPREQKTADPARYARLGLGDPGEGSDSLGVSLSAADGSVVAGFVLGLEVNSGSTAQRYVRTVGEAQSWLAEGRIDAPTDAMRWVDTSVTQIARDRVTRVTITHPDGEVVSLAKEQGGTSFVLESVPEGRVPKAAGQVGAPASALGYLRFEDVRAGEDLTDEVGEPVIAVYETTDGLTVTVRTWQLDGKVWASFTAEGAAAAKPEGEGESGGEPPAGPDAASEAEELNGKLAGWLYAVPQYQADSFRRRLVDLTDEQPEPAEDPAAEEPEAGDEPGFEPRLDAADEPGGG